MRDKNLLLGKVFKLHGFKGSVNIYSNIALEDLKITEHLLVKINGTLIPYKIGKIQQKKNNIFIVKFEEINSENDAIKILKKNIYFPNRLISKITENKSILGFQVFDINIGLVGEVTYVNSTTPQKLIFVSKNSKEFCFPMHKKFVNNICYKKRMLKVDIPEEIINLN